MFDPAQAERLFDAANGLADEVARQNARIPRLNEFDDPDMRALVQAGLADTQTETMEQLEKAGDRAPYAAVGEKSLNLLAIVDNLRRTKAKMDAYINTRKATLEQSVVAGEEIAGKELPKLRLLVAQSIAKLPEVIEQQYPGLEGKLAEATDGLSTVEALFAIAGKAWPLPRVRYPETLPEVVLPAETASEPVKPLPNSLPYPSYSHARPASPVVLPTANLGTPEFMQPPPPEGYSEDDKDMPWKPLESVPEARPDVVAEPDVTGLETASKKEQMRDALLTSPSNWVIKSLLMEPNKIWTHRTIAEAMWEARVYGDKPLKYVEGRVRNIIGSALYGRHLRARLVREAMFESQRPTPIVDLQRGTCRTPGVQGRPHQVYRLLELTETNRQLMEQGSEEPQDDGTIIIWEQTVPLEDLQP